LKNIVHVSPYLFENYLLISLDKKWIEVCNGIPKFVVFIGDDKKLHLVSTQEVKK